MRTMRGLRARRLLAGAALACATMLALAAPAAAQPAPDPALAAAQSAFEALAEAERKAIQSDLVWTGDYSGVVDGSFGRRSFEALAAFEARNRTKADGVLDPAERAALAQQAARQVAALRFQSLRDERSGIRIGVPLALLPKREALPGGVRFSSADGKASLTLTSGAAVGDFPALYQQALQAGPGLFVPGLGGAGKVSYRVLRPDWFVIAGEAGTSRYYLRQAQTPQGLRGYVLRYETGRAGEFDRIAIAIANSFEPLGNADPAPAIATQAQPSGTSPPGPVLTARTGTALRIGAGRYVLPARLVQDCKALAVDNRSASVMKAMGSLAFVGTDSRKAATGFAIASPADGAAIVLAHADLGAGLALVAVPARLAGDRITGVFQTGVTGAPVIDASGALVGLVAEDPMPARRIGGLLPEASLRIVPGADITQALADARVSAAASSSEALTSGLVARLWRERLAPVDCAP
jgi:hypothetical protein